MSIQTDTNKSDLLEDLLLKKVHIKNDWSFIKEQFCKSHPLFFIEYIKSSILLTTSEEQLLVLENMGFNTKTISEILNVLPESIHKNRYRLKKKMNLKNLTT